MRGIPACSDQSVTSAASLRAVHASPIGLEVVRSGGSHQGLGHAASVQQESTATLGGNRWTPADSDGHMIDAQNEVFKRRFDATSFLQAEGRVRGYEFARSPLSADSLPSRFRALY
jgi:hypothetical protein